MTRARGAPPWSPDEPLALVREVKDYAIFMIGPDGRILTWNEGARLIKGYEADEIVGEAYARFFTEEDRAAGRPAALLRRAAEEGRVEDEGWRVRKDGSRFWADAVLTAVHDAAGALRGFVKVTRDLTERRRAEELLRQSEERLRLLVESARDYAIFMLDPDGAVASWNAGAQRLKGYGADEIVGRPYEVFYPPDEAATDGPRRQLERAATEGRCEAEGWRLRKDGSRFWASVVISAIHDPDTGRLRGFVKVTRDMTERRRLEQATLDATEAAGRAQARALEAETAVASRDQFISVAAHELRTPLTALQLKLQGLARRIARPGVEAAVRLAEAGGRLDGALRQVRRLADLIERMLDVSRLGHGELALRRERVDLAELVRLVVDDAREHAAEAGAEVRVAAAAGAVGWWDRARIEQVVVNLVSNAIKYGAGRPIDVRVEPDEAEVRLVVADRGIGIAAAELGRVFERFARAVPATHYPGLGLGLYIARTLVERHGGSVRVTSRPGEGSTFVVVLPRGRGGA